LGDVDPRLEPYKTDFQREKIIVLDLAHLGGDPHSRAFDEVHSVMGMIERRLAQGQQLDERASRDHRRHSLTRSASLAQDMRHGADQIAARLRTCPDLIKFVQLEWQLVARKADAR
jgi:hypothetical protein